ncbi:DUF6597 domain-containing transcriptional factor [Actinoplanes sp. NPDC049599]|uniref:DUF6597 domain-containing transcriptional factor n=1 Tax=Actinoplanes sp. NPDC049599 TaxID=3363903 RepID=UPI00378F192E
MEYVSRVPRPPLDGLIDDLYYLEGAPPYARLTLPASPAALLIVNLGAPFRIRAGAGIKTAEYADGCVVTTPTRAWEFGYPARTRSVGVHFKPWGPAPFLPMPAAELCDRPVTVEQVWGRAAVAELRDRLATANGPHEMLTLLEEELLRRLGETAGLGLVRRTSGVIAATGWPAPTASPPPCCRSTPPDRSTGPTSPVAPATSTRPTSATSSGPSPGLRRPATSRSGGGSCANIPATCWTAGRCRPIDFLQERRLTTR